MSWYNDRPPLGHWYAHSYDCIKNGSIDGTDEKPHDKGLVRALKYNYKPENDPNIKGNPLLTLFVSRLNYETNEDTLKEYFSQYGQIKRVKLIRDIVTGASKGYAFVEFTRSSDYRVAFRKAHRKQIDDYRILVDYARSLEMPGFKPRRVGGGLSGKKESGQLRFGGRDRPFNAPFNKKLYAENKFKIDTKTPEKYNSRNFSNYNYKNDNSSSYSKNNHYNKSSPPRREYRDRSRSRNRYKSRSRSRNKDRSRSRSRSRSRRNRRN